MTLDLIQLAVLGVVASLLAQGYKLIVAKWGKDTSTKVLMGVISVISIGLGYFWLKPQLPVLGDDPLKFATDIIAVASSILGFATLIYNWLLASVFDKLNLVVSAFFPRYKAPKNKEWPE